VVLVVASMTKADSGVVVVVEDLTLLEASNNNLHHHPVVEAVMEVDHQEVHTEEDNLVEVSSQEEEVVVDHNPLLHTHRMVDLLTHANANLTVPHRRS